MRVACGRLNFPANRFTRKTLMMIVTPVPVGLLVVVI